MDPLRIFHVYWVLNLLLCSVVWESNPILLAYETNVIFPFHSPAIFLLLQIYGYFLHIQIILQNNFVAGAGNAHDYL